MGIPSTTLATSAVLPGERRSSTRHDLVGNAVLTTPAGDISARVRNISLGGCCLELPSAPLEVGSAVHLRFAISGTNFDLNGTVANVQQGSRIGIQFAAT